MTRITVQTIRRRLEQELGINANRSVKLAKRHTEHTLRLRRSEALDLIDFLKGAGDAEWSHLDRRLPETFTDIAT